MAQIGNLGSLIVFEVSDQKVLTFRNLKRTTSGRWTTHNVIGKTPVSEFQGPGQEKISLDIHLSVMHGVKPRKTIDRIRKAIRSGTPFLFVMGGKKVGENQWVISDMSETWNTVIKDGHLASADIAISLSEYV